jgi:hypothetical protein
VKSLGIFDGLVNDENLMETLRFAGIVLVDSTFIWNSPVALLRRRVHKGTKSVLEHTMTEARLTEKEAAKSIKR